jgi:hypothetical protein
MDGAELWHQPLETLSSRMIIVRFQALTQRE